MNHDSGHVSIAGGFLLILLAAVMNGAYAIPMKFIRSWQWENTWLTFTILSLWVFPAVTAWVTIPQPLVAYRDTPGSVLLFMALIGLLWGAGVLLLGMSYPLVGVAVSNAVGLGCAAVAGTVLPIFFGDVSSRLTESTGTIITIGVVVAVLGVAVCGVAGRLREQHRGNERQVGSRAIKGLLLASLGGTLTAALNLALAVGTSIRTAVAQQHPSSSGAGIAVWIPVLLAGGLPGIFYTMALLGRNGSARYWAEEGPASLALTGVMGILWLGSIVVYGNGVLLTGSLGVIIGWPVFMSGAVIASAGWGTVFGEWRSASWKAVVLMIAGVFLLSTAITILGSAGH